MFQKICIIVSRILESLYLDALPSRVFYFISASFDIPASLSISRDFSSVFKAGGNPPRHCQDNYQIRLDKLDLMCEKLSYQIINILAVN